MTNIGSFSPASLSKAPQLDTALILCVTINSTVHSSLFSLTCVFCFLFIYPLICHCTVHTCFLASCLCGVCTLNGRPIVVARSRGSPSPIHREPATAPGPEEVHWWGRPNRKGVRGAFASGAGGGRAESIAKACRPILSSV